MCRANNRSLSKTENRPVRLRLLLAVACTALVVTSSLQAQPVVDLNASNLFPQSGETVEFTITGPPAATFVLRAAQQPAERPFGAEGTIFLESETARIVGSGELSEDGTATVLLRAPADLERVGEFFFAQARVVSGGEGTLTRALPVRIGSGPLAGARRPVAIAVTETGDKVYVAHQRDGSLSVIDPVTDTVLFDLPAGPEAGNYPQVPIDLAIDPEGRHLFFVHANAELVTVFDVLTDSVSARVPVPRGSQRIAFDFSDERRVYVTNDRTDSVLVFEERPLGVFSPLPNIPLEGLDPGAIAVLPDGRLMVAERATLELEIVDPQIQGASATVARIAVDTAPLDLTLLDDVALVTKFSLLGDGSDVPSNEILRVDLDSFVVLDRVLVNDGTDYLAVTDSDTLIAVAAGGSGNVLIADRDTAELLDRVDLAPAPDGTDPDEIVPTAVPRDVAFLPDSAGGLPTRLYAINQFRETVRPISLLEGPPYTLEPEIPLAHSGAPRVPLVDLTPEEDGDWFYHSVVFFGGSANSPNPVTCFSCHHDGPGNRLNSRAGLQIPQVFAPLETGPWGLEGNLPDLGEAIFETGQNLSIFETDPPIGSTELLLDFLEIALPPAPSPYLLADGSLTAEALAGQSLFEGVAQCSVCHTAPLFIPQDEEQLTIEDGVGTGLVPANVPSLRAVWNSAPYLGDGSAQTLRDVLLMNTTDEHGVTTGLSEQELDQLVAYLRSL